MVFDKIKEIISEQFTIDENSITKQMAFTDDLGADSLDVVELTMAIEEEFDISEVSEDDLKTIVTVGDLVTYVTLNMR